MESVTKATRVVYADYWRHLLGDTYPENAFRIGDALFARDGNVVLELLPYEHGASVTVHAGFIKTQDFPFAHYFQPAVIAGDRTVPRLLSYANGWAWSPHAPSEIALDSLRDALRDYITLWRSR